MCHYINMTKEDRKDGGVFLSKMVIILTFAMQDHSEVILNNRISPVFTPIYSVKIIALLVKTYITASKFVIFAASRL